jgi:hypothetical protein
VWARSRPSSVETGGVILNAQVAEEIRADVGAALGAVALEWAWMNAEPPPSVDAFLGALPRTQAGHVLVSLPNVAGILVLYCGSMELVRALLHPAN